MVPQTPIGGWGLNLTVQARFMGISGLLIASAASGYGAGQSGITIVNSGNGVFSAQIPGIITSGWNSDAYSYAFRRTDSGAVTILACGFLNLLPT